MSEPTIGEMLDFLSGLGRIDVVQTPNGAELRYNMVSGGFGSVDNPRKRIEIAIIRAFVERVMARLSGEYGSVSDPKLGELLMAAIRDEVAAMEAEVKG
jgi:hypothetical protein